MRTFTKNENIQSILRYIIYLNFVVSASAAMLCAGFAKMIGWSKMDVLLFGLYSFFGTLAVYNGQRLFKFSEVKTPWLRWVRVHTSSITILTVIASAISLVFSLMIVYRNGVDIMRIAVWMSPAVAISFLYIFRLKGRNLRDVPNLKIHLIAFAWVSILILFPFLTRFYVTESFIRSFIALIIGHYFYVLAVTIPFDIRDLKYDEKNQKTIPQRIGVHGSKLLSIVLLLLGSIFLVGLTPIRSDNYMFYLAIAVQIGLVLGMSTKRSDLYCAGWVDGAIALLGLAYFMN